MPVGTAFLAALYYGPDGVTDDSLLTQTGDAVGFGPEPGLYFGGGRILTNAPCGGAAMGQVRAWEAAFGSTYEEAILAPPQNGRMALAGKSNLIRIDFLSCILVPTYTLPYFGLQGFTLTVVPEPSGFHLAVIGAGLFFLASHGKKFGVGEAERLRMET